MVKINIKTFPQVWKNSKNGIIQIIYRNRIEIYSDRGISKYSKAQIDLENPETHYDYEDIFGKGWNAYHESDIMKNNGFKSIQYYEVEE